ncbi:MAG TPA: type II toxin-antitoxin system VapC family toxin [Gaiellaceae bacterium]|nr:type II toxin-antitoxin system VapC family toxin [Gaiellaceae bacterium]
MRLVADASALAEYVLSAPRARLFALRIEHAEADLHAPELCDLEIASSVTGALRAGRLTAQRAAELLEDYLELPLVLHEHRPLLPRVLELWTNFSAYDAAYVALAETLKAPLLTADEALARATRAHTNVEVVAP